jgi:hypothetical protein
MALGRDCSNGILIDACAHCPSVRGSAKGKRRRWGVPRDVCPWHSCSLPMEGGGFDEVVSCGCVDVVARGV